MRDEKLERAIGMLVRGRLKPYALAEVTSDENEASRIRRGYIEKVTGIRLENIANTSIDFSDASSRNIENAIGAVQIPVGFAEIHVKGEYLKGTVPVFLATTEGKLVAGVNRGATVINKSGGATTKVLYSGMTRSVLLDTSSAIASAKAMAYLKRAGRVLIKNIFERSNKRLKLLNIDTYSTGRLLYIRYTAETNAAMGMNMLTIASTSATRALISALKRSGINAKFVSESGNMCADKKPSAINIIKGRGISVIAEAVIKKELLHKYFKTDAKGIEELNYEKNYVGSSLAGSLAHNAHVANVLAATFIAYGQDVAQIVDGVNAFDDAKALTNGDLYLSVYLPALELGTYGGGTHRETAQELLKASGVYGEGDDKGVTKYGFAELIASTVLAGELNLLAAEAGQELASAHAALKK